MMRPKLVKVALILLLTFVSSLFLLLVCAGLLSALLIVCIGIIDKCFIIFNTFFSKYFVLH